MSTVDTKRATVSLQRTNSTGTVALHQSIAARFPTKVATVSATTCSHRVTEFSFSECSADAAEATTSAHPFHEQSVPGELSAYANLSAAAPAATTAAAAAATSGLYNVPDVVKSKRNTSLHAAHSDRPNVSTQWKPAGKVQKLFARPRHRTLTSIRGVRRQRLIQAYR